jgi:glutathione S-transferase
MARNLRNREAQLAARYTLFIGSKNWSSWSLRPWLAMKMAKIPFEEVLIPLRTADTKAAILALSPSGKVPALHIAERGKETIVWDSLAICETLADQYPGAKLWPKSPALRAEARSIAAEMHSGFQGMRNTLSMEIAARHKTPPLDDVTRNDIARVIAIWNGALARKAKGGFLFGHFTIADAFYAPVATRFATYGIPVSSPARAYMRRLLALAPMKEWTKAAKKEAESSR